MRLVLFVPCQEGWHRPALSLFAKVSLVFSCKLPKVTCFQKFVFAQRSGAMKAPVGLLSDRTVLRKQDGGARPDKFAFAQRSGAMKAPVGLLSDRTVLRKQDGGAPPRQVRVCTAKRSNESPSGAFKRQNGLAQQDGGAPPRQVRVWCKNRACGGCV